MGGRSRNTDRDQALPFHNSYVLIYWRISNLIYGATWPFQFNAINLVGRPYPQNIARVVRSQIAATSVFKATSLRAGSDPSNNCSDRSGITLGGDQLQSNP